MNRIKPLDKNVNINTDSLSGIEYPVFCFKYLQFHSIKDCAEADFFFKFLERLQKLSELGWKEIRKSARHSFGTEKLSRGSIIPDLPKFVSPDVEHLTVFRANGDNRPFLGIQRGKLFHVIFIECRFGDIYEHN